MHESIHSTHCLCRGIEQPDSGMGWGASKVGLSAKIYLILGLLEIVHIKAPENLKYCSLVLEGR